MSKNPQWKLTQLSGGDSEIAMSWWLSGKTMNTFFKEKYGIVLPDGWKAGLTKIK